MVSCIARQRGPLGTETSIWPCLTASGRQILIFYHVSEIYPSVDLRIRDVECPELLAELCLIPEVCPTASSLRLNRWILNTSRLKALFAINSFDSQCGLDVPGRSITLRAELL